MTIPQHAIQSGMICLLIPKLRNRYIIISAIMLTVIPDVGRFFQHNPHDWTKFYQWAHTTWYCFFIPFWNLHIAEDYLMHQPNGGWYWWAYYGEGLLWLLEAIMIYAIIKQNYYKRKQTVI